MSNAIQHAFARFTTTRRALMVAGILAVTLGTSGAAMAQGHGKHERRAQWEQMSEAEKQEAISKRHARKMEHLTRELGLTQAQVPQVSDILERAHAERRAIKQANKGDRAAAKPQMKALRERTRAELDAVLTPEQAERMEQMHEERRAKKKQRKQGRRAQRMERMIADLELSAEQEAQVRAVFASAKQERAQIIELVGSREEARPELKALKLKTQGEVRALLNEEQIAKMDAKKAARKARRGSKKG